ncbi:MAG: hypothetical protein COY80_00170 [Candidatus Pacebacteria bacterium CG_4_10_14_0_8_um_filter_42_14]|nr:MAG: hypothetical protein COY80_00170 [Candidatus Pacebacteria bacterium CG_4_10_14_0_8_um_filter_42_14]
MLRKNNSPYLRTWIFIGLLALTAVIVGFATRYYQEKYPLPSALAEPMIQESEEVEEVVASSSTELPLSQKMAVPLLIDSDHNLTSDLAWMAERKFGAITIFGTNISKDQMNSVSNQLALYPDWNPLLIVDHEGGTVQRLSGEGFTKLPSWQELCTLPEEEQVSLLDASFSELKEVGINMVLAPVVDLGPSPVLKSRACSSDPKVVVAATKRFIAQAKKYNIQPVLKHYPGLGTAKFDSHKSFEVIQPTEADLQVFSDLLDLYPDLSVMIAHVGIANQESDLPCSLSSSCINSLKTLYPDTYIISDALEMKGALELPDGSERSLSEATEMAMSAGVDLLLYGSPVSYEEIDAVLNELNP